MQRADLLDKTLMLQKIEGRRSRQERMRWLGSITNSVNMDLGKLWKIVKTEMPGMVLSMGSQELDMT